MDIDFSEPLIVKSAFLPRGHVLCNAEDYEIVERLIDSYVTKQTGRRRLMTCPACGEKMAVRKWHDDD